MLYFQLIHNGIILVIPIFVYWETIMKLLILILFVLFITNSSLPGGIYICKYASEADIKIFVADYKSEADLCVYVAQYKSEAEDYDQIWYFVDYASEVDAKIFYVKYKSEADLIIYFVDYKSEAGWQRQSKYRGRIHS